MLKLVENNSNAHLAYLVPETLHFMFFKMADSGHLGFRGQDES